MTHPSDQKQTQPPPAKGNEADAPAKGNEADELSRLPDVLIDDEQPDVFDLPRKGVVKPVANVSKGSIRLPDVLIED